ncbi:hypothetical protein [Clostridium botulinum]|uniref:Uncharacterized protein n=1 Tax=Clostridium botulinum TaxID=1491 RepID=A0A6B4JNY2_CLOBO|nr:hypothetical protein [Clostridium botulinum]EES50821.1 hypothetical protein CLO_1827 [Clostridium botulinum E1 str. 'BoNT E Beluga']MBY6761885.1 hypothetical protein [Clostridium botulinum]MBY6920811.1 hypothetical protein [Clostridium botulinum]MCR1131440.1 hypothetical protein [Clostridium botulinum]NFG21983.1 hypothetical protein [Clostridium botulinum]
MKEDEEKKFIIWITTIGLILPFLIYAIIDSTRGGYIHVTKDNMLVFYGTIIGACFTGIITAVGLFITTKQTRQIQEENLKMQERLIKLEENKQKFGLRTNFREFIVESDIELNKYIRTLEGSMLIITEEYKYINSLLNDGVEYFKINTSIINGKNTRFVNISEFDSTICDLKNFKRYLFKAVSNVGNNPMHNIGIHMRGLWFQAHDQIYKSGEIEASIDYIEKSKTILLPLFKLDDKLMLWQFSPEMITLYYYTELSGNRERIITKIYYDSAKQQIDKYSIVEDVTSNEENISSSFIEYKII